MSIIHQSPPENGEFSAPNLHFLKISSKKKIPTGVDLILAILARSDAAKETVLSRHLFCKIIASDKCFM